MKMDSSDTFVVAGAGIHIGVFVLGYIVVGAEYTALLFILWGLAWLTYCGRVAERWEETGNGEYDAQMSVPALALIGGPLCWILCPGCLWPATQRRADGFVFFWNVAVRLALEVLHAVLKIMSLLHDLCHKKHPSDDVEEQDTEV